MHPTVRALLAESSLRLTVLEPGADDALDATVSWAHGSDLLDPTPFLDAGQILLTTGTQFLEGGADHAEYVARLVRAGVAALGFGTEVATAGTPARLVDACTSAGLPLFEVPYEIPFIAIARSIADRVAAAEHARDDWSLGALRAIAFAALRPDGLPATLDELARQLGRTVALVDAAGGVTHGSLAPEGVRDGVRAEAVRLLARGQRSSSTLRVSGAAASLQTIGRRGELRGVLAVVGGGDLDSADQSVITSVVALAGLALEQGREVLRARAAVRGAAVRALLDGHVDLAESALADIGERVPSGQVVVARVTLAPSGDARSGDAGGSVDADGSVDARRVDSAVDPADGVLSAVHDGDGVLIGAPRGVDATLQRIHRSSSDADAPLTLRAGVSSPAGWDALGRADREARAAREAATPATPVVHAEDLGTRGVDWLFARPGTRDLAAAVLRPIAEDTVLLESLEAWLVANGQTDPAARRLGVHRHTLRARISTIERLLGRDLSGVDARTEAWIALRAIRTPPPE
jgi:purine catabolism regulator